MEIAEIIDWIKASNGRIFSIKFIKRSTGEERLMLCRTGVKKKLKGGVSIDFRKCQLIPVYDMQQHAYRSIPIEGILAIKIGGKWHDRIGSVGSEAKSNINFDFESEKTIVSG